MGLYFLGLIIRAIYEQLKKAGHVKPTKARFAERSSAEHVNSDLKDNYGGSHVHVKGAW